MRILLLKDKLYTGKLVTCFKSIIIDCSLYAPQYTPIFLSMSMQDQTGVKNLTFLSTPVLN